MIFGSGVYVVKSTLGVYKNATIENTGKVMLFIGTCLILSLYNKVE